MTQFLPPRLNRPKSSRTAGARAFDFSALEPAARRFESNAATILARQVAIAEIAAPTGQESARARAVARWLGASGRLTVRRDDAGNVLATVPSRVGRDDQAAPVVILAHLDTVFTETTLPATHRDGPRVCLPGIGDNSRGVAALLALGDALMTPDVAEQLMSPVELVATVGEEGAGNLRGARQYFDDRERRGAPRPLAVIALDGPGDQLVVHQGISSHRLRIALDGPGGHPWVDVGVPNAIHVCGAVIAALAQFSRAQRSGTTVHVTRMGGGESLTAIPASAWFELDIRSADPGRLPTLLDAVRRLVQRACVDESTSAVPVVARVTTLGERPGGALDAQHPLVQLANAATEWQGHEARSACASTDANIPLSRGIPAITIGAGGTGGGAHTAHEWYDDTNSARGLARALGVVVGAAGGWGLER